MFVSSHIAAYSDGEDEVEDDGDDEDGIDDKSHDITISPMHHHHHMIIE